MRKVYTLILIALMSAGSSLAQRNIDWSVESILKPTELNSNTSTGTSFNIEAVFKNNGSDTVFSGDTILYQIILMNANNQLIFALPSTTGFNIAARNRQINPGDTMHAHVRFNFSNYPISSMNVRLRVATLVINRGANKVADEPTAGQANNIKINDMVWWNPQKFGVGIEEVSAEVLMAIHPNPATNQLNIDYKMVNVNAPNTIRVFDLQGKLVLEHNSASGSIGETVDITSLSPGLYMVKVGNGEMEATQKIQIIH